MMERVIPEKRKLCSCISWIAWGYIFIHCHVNIGRLDILPDWLGYFLITASLKYLAEEEVATLELLRPLGSLLVAWSFADWCFVIAERSLDLPIVSVMVSVINMYFHFQLLTDIANISGRYGTPEHRQILRLRTVEVVIYTVVALQRFLSDDLAGRLVARFTAGDLSGWTDLYTLWSGIMVFTMFVVVIWLCKLLFNLKKSLILEFSSLDGSQAD